MPIQETKIIDQITVMEDGVVLYRECSRITRDGVLIGQQFHRSTVSPGQDVGNIPTQVAAVCNAVWTPEVISAFASRHNPTI